MLVSNNRFRSQPQVSVRVNWSNPISRGLQLAYVDGLKEAVHNRRSTIVGAVSPAIISGQRVYTNWSTSNYINDLSASYVAPPFTLMCYASADTSIGGVSNGTFFSFQGAGGGHGWKVGNDLTQLLMTFGAVSDYLFTGSFFVTGVRYLIAVTVSGTTAIAYRNGVLWDTQTVGSPLSPSGTLAARLGVSFNGGSIGDGQGAAQFIGETLVWNRALSSAEIAQMWAGSPYQIFSFKINTSANSYPRILERGATWLSNLSPSLVSPSGPLQFWSNPGSGIGLQPGGFPFPVSNGPSSGGGLTSGRRHPRSVRSQ